MFREKLGLDKLHLESLGLDRRLEGLEEALVDSTALLAVVGAGDLAVQRLRAARAQIANRSASFDPATVRERAQARLTGGLEALQARLMVAPDQIMELPELAQELPMRAQSMLADIASAAFSTYGELAVRGKSVVMEAPFFAGSTADTAYDDVVVTRPQTPVTPPGSAAAATPALESAPPALKRPKPAAKRAKPVAKRATAAATPAATPAPTPPPTPPLTPAATPTPAPKPAAKPRRRAGAGSPRAAETQLPPADASR